MNFAHVHFVCDNNENVQCNFDKYGWKTNIVDSASIYFVSQQTSIRDFRQFTKKETVVE